MSVIAVGAKECVACPAGFFQNLPGEDSIGCDPGKYANTTRATRCKECSEGQFAPDKTQSIVDGLDSVFPNKKTEQEIYDGFGLNSKRTKSRRCQLVSTV